jgi:tRNA1(Val) A37 N6-methylase TrmN6
MPQAPGPGLAPVAADANTGEVFTRRWVVDTILDLVNYDAADDLADKLIVEPACGTGAFLVPIVERLSASLRKHDRELADATNALRSWDLKEANVQASRRAVADTLVADGWPKAHAVKAASAWIAEGDFLLEGHKAGTADFVVGNPPYVRLEELPADRLDAYRAACKTMAGRSDIYVGFFEHGLCLLKDGGRLGFICADRWMKNDYGRKLREFITDGFSIDSTIVMHDVDAFEESVSAYPAISVIRRGEQKQAVIADTKNVFGEAGAREFVKFAANPRTKKTEGEGFSAARLAGWYSGSESWPWASPARLEILEDLNNRFVPLEESAPGTRVGIGVATGKDGVFVVSEADVEKSRLLPLSMSKDIATGELKWSGQYLVNPWDENGLVSLADYPKFAAYMDAHQEQIAGRAIAKKQEKSWYRTIDRVDMSLTSREKLLFPDMKMTTHPVYDPGGLYPHHNLYYVVSDEWDLRVLGGLLLSAVAEMFVDCYCVKMRGGTLRFQAQYLRRIRVPRPTQISARDRRDLAGAFEKRDGMKATETALRVYGIEGIPK